MTDYQDKLEQVIRKDLCTRCGACVGLGNGKIAFKDKEGKYLPKIKEPLAPEEAERIWTACSGQEVDFPGLTQTFYGDTKNYHPYLGSYESLNIGFTVDSHVRRSGGSAGVITSVLIWLLEKGKIDGAVVLGMDEKEPWMNKVFIARTREEILSAAQSKYTISSNNEILSTIKEYKGKLAYVGLPCQVQSIRKLQHAGDESVKAIKYIIAPFCGLNLHFSSISHFLKAHGAKDHTQISKLSFREGEWPGHMHVELQNGKVIQLKKFFANYLIPFHMMNRCNLCVDATNEFTDISVGDAWAPVYEERGKGFSFVIGRSKAGEEVLREMEKEQIIDLKAIDTDHAVKMHSHMYDNKKRGAFIRINKRRLKPDYNLPFPESIDFKRRMFEFVMNTIYVILRTYPMRKLFEILPPQFVGTYFDKFKVFWKKITYNVKRKEL